MMLRKIKSYVLRGSGLTDRQKQGLAIYHSHYSLPLTQGVWNFSHIFNRQADTIIEIGFGMGQSLFEMAKCNPHINYIGIEVHQAGVGSLAASVHEAQLSNVRLISHDAVEIFDTVIPDNSLTGIQIFFPDPWPKNKHHKRRLIQVNFVNTLVKKLRMSGFIHAATDWEHYAHDMLSVFQEIPELTNQSKDHGFIDRPATRPLTKFEEKGLNQGHKVFDLLFLR